MHRSRAAAEQSPPMHRDPSHSMTFLMQPERSKPAEDIHTGLFNGCSEPVLVK